MYCMAVSLPRGAACRIERAERALAIQCGEGLDGGIAQEQLQPVEALAAALGDGGEAVAERQHPEVGRRVARIAAIESIEERRDLEQPRAVLDEIFIHELFRAKRRSAVHAA